MEDFKTIHLEQEDNFSTHWSTIVPKVIELAKRKAGADKHWEKLISDNGIVLNKTETAGNLLFFITFFYFFSVIWCS